MGFTIINKYGRNEFMKLLILKNININLPPCPDR